MKSSLSKTALTGLIFAAGTQSISMHANAFRKLTQTIVQTEGALLGGLVGFSGSAFIPPSSANQVIGFLSYPGIVTASTAAGVSTGYILHKAAEYIAPACKAVKNIIPLPLRIGAAATAGISSLAYGIYKHNSTPLA
jgi:hypothetical protein